MIEDATNDILKKGTVADEDVLVVRPFEDTPFKNPEFLNHTHNGLDSPRILANNVMNLVGTGQTATFVIGPASNSDSDTYDYVTDGTDDNVEIQAAIDALPTDGGSICFREGTYILGATVTVAKNGVTLFGMGKGTIISCKTNLNNIFFLLGHSSTQYKNCVLKDLYFDGNKSNQSSGTDKPIIDNDSNTKPIQNVEILDCYFANAKSQCITNNSTGDTSDNYMLIQGNFFKDWDGITVSSTRKCAIYIYGSRGTSTIISHNYFTNSSTTIGYVWANASTDNLINNIFDFPDGYDYTAVKNFYRVSKNIFYSNDSVSAKFGSSCILIDTCRDVEGNLLQSNASSGDGIGIKDCYWTRGNVILYMGVAIKNPRLICTNNYIEVAFNGIAGIGIHLETYGNVVVTNNYLSLAGNSGSTYILIKCTNNIISSNTIIGTSSGGFGSTNYGIRENTSSDGPNIISNNMVTGTFNTAAISIQHPSSDVSHNITS